MSDLNTIKELREKTGAGMVSCKKALDEAEGDAEKAIELLRKQGIAKSAKRGDRETCEGIVLVDANDDNTEGYNLEINSETDFVARNEKFQDLAKKILELIKEHKPKDIDELNALSLDTGTVKEEVDNLSGVIGEKLAVKRFGILTGETVAAYSHMNGRIGVLVALNKANEAELARDIAMQVAATNPQYLKTEDVPEEVVAKEKEVYKEQLLKEGKPENIIEKIMEGKIRKFYEEVCLLKQEYIKDDKKKVEEILGEAVVKEYIRYSL